MKTISFAVLKTNLPRLMAVLAVAIFVASTAAAQAQFNYETNNGTITITKYIGPGGDVTIPETITGLPVTSIGGGAFAGSTNLTSVTIPNSVTSIGAEAFAFCTNLTSVMIPDSVTSIQPLTFYGCSSLTNITIPYGVTSIGNVAFSDCTSLTSITIPDSVTWIDLGALRSCSGLTTVVIPNSVTSIQPVTFLGCTSLTNVLIGNSVTSIGSGAFACCSNLTSVTIPNSVTNIGDDAASLFGGVFAQCTTLTSVTIGNGVATIWDLAFHLCTNLTGVYFGGNAPTAGEDVFLNAANVIVYHLSETAGWGATFGGRATAVWVPYTYITNNGTITITGYTGLGGAVTIPSQIGGLPVTGIGGWAFAYSTSLSSITIPDGVSTIGDYAFYECDGLASVAIGTGVESIGFGAFCLCTSLASLTIPDSVTIIGDQAFAVCSSLTSITVNALNSTYSSLDGVLFNKNQTTLIRYPGGRVGSYAIPNGVTSIRHEAFSYCHNLTGVTVPSSVLSIEEWTFNDCTRLSAIEVDAANPAYSSLEGVLFSKNRETIIQYPASRTGSYTIPTGVTSIGSEAFIDCIYLTEIAIPNTLTRIREWAFFNCGSLTSVDIPNSVTSIGDYAFRYCTSLASVTIGKSVTSVGDWAFYDCADLTGVYFWGNAPTIGHNAFGHTHGSLRVTVSHLPGAFGWGTTFGGRPTALWVLPYPVILTTAPNFGIQNNAFGFRISWATNVPVVVEASTTLANPVWSPVSTNTLTGGWTYFSDAEWTNYPARFYRIRQW